MNTSIHSPGLRAARRGATMIYLLIGMLALFAIISLAVDWGRVQLAQSQLQNTADAAARYAVVALKNDLGSGSTAKNNAAAVVSQNLVDGRRPNINLNEDVQIGIWNSSTKTFTPNANVDLANAVRVTLQCSDTRGNAIPLTFAPLIGRKTASITATSTAIMDFSVFGAAANAGAGGGTFKFYIPATSNPWLAGAPAGTIANPNNPHNNPDFAGQEFRDDGTGSTRTKGNSGANSKTGAGSGFVDTATGEANWSSWGDYSPKKGSPIKAGMPVVPGTNMTFDGINGGANNFSSTTLFTGDGNTGQIFQNRQGNENGIANLKAPGNSVIAVFLDDTDPTTKTSYPPTLDFSTATQRDFLSLSPQLRQPFFIGDGRRSNGETQRFVVPAGATRLFIGTMDTYEWNNNVGGFEVTSHLSGKIVTVE